MDVVFALSELPFPTANQRVRQELWRLRMPVLATLKLPKHTRPGALWHDMRELRRIAVRDRLDVVHTHQLSDQLVAATAFRSLGGGPVHIHSLYEARLPRIGLRFRHALAGTDGVVAPTKRVADELVHRFGFDPERVLLQEPVVEPKALIGPDRRREWQIPADEFIVAITARIQPHRRFDLLWETVRKVADAVPGFRLVLLGRGNEEDSQMLVREPVRRLGIEANVLMPGYQYGSEYEAALRTVDAFLFLVPGSDGTCRAVRDAMSFGLPVVCTRRGMLPEIVRPDASGTPPGTACEEDAEELAAALVSLARNPQRRLAMGQSALSRTRHDMDPGRAAVRLASFYREVHGLSRERG